MYVRKKDLTDLRARVKLKIDKRCYLDVYIWMNLSSMQKNTDPGKDGYHGCYISLPYVEYTDPDRVRKVFGPKYGEIHLVDGMYGAGTFAHELQHFILHWSYDNDMNLDPPDESGWIPEDSDQEKICILAGRLTTSFWGQFYELGLDKPEE